MHLQSTDFCEIALKMTNFANLETRVERGIAKTPVRIFVIPSAHFAARHHFRVCPVRKKLDLLVMYLKTKKLSFSSRTRENCAEIRVIERP